MCLDGGKLSPCVVGMSENYDTHNTFIIYFLLAVTAAMAKVPTFCTQVEVQMLVLKEKNTPVLLQSSFVLK